MKRLITVAVAVALFVFGIRSAMSQVYAQSAGDQIIGPYLYAGGSHAVFGVPEGYGMRIRFAWAAGVKYVYALNHDLLAGSYLGYTKRAWDAQKSDDPNTYIDLRIEHVYLTAYLRYKWLIGGVQLMQPVAAESDVTSGGATTIEERAGLKTEWNAVLGAGIHLWGDLEGEFRGTVLANYPLGSNFPAWDATGTGVQMLHVPEAHVVSFLIGIDYLLPVSVKHRDYE